MNIKQKYAVAAIVLIAALLAGSILIGGKGSQGGQEDHAEIQIGKEAGKAEEDHDKQEDKHGEKHEEKHEGAKAHQDEEHHEIALTGEQIKAAGIVVETAAGGKIRNSLQLPGEIRFNADQTAHIVPRVAGVVESVSANLGQQVKRGQILATISSSAVSELRSELRGAQQRLALAKTSYVREKELWEEKISAQQDYLEAQKDLREAEIAVRNAQQKLNAIGADTGAAASKANTNANANGSGLNRYQIRAPFDGMVVEKHLALGESVKEDTNIFTISDLSTVWAEVSVAAGDLKTVRTGAAAVVRATAFDAVANGHISYVSALLGEQTRTAKANIVLQNPGNAWRPGLFVSVEVSAGEADVPVMVKADAIQSIEQKDTVFVRVPDGFVAQQVKLGRADASHVEIVDGLKPGTPYAAAGSFAIKAELGKDSAEHSH
jgi:cobalt-zinc-cadmium efflux system membrane fusion protein